MLNYPDRVFEANIEASSPGEQGVLRGAEPMWVVFDTDNRDIMFERPTISECSRFISENSLFPLYDGLVVADKDTLEASVVDRWDKLADERRASGDLHGLHLHECQLQNIANRRRVLERLKVIADSVAEKMKEDISHMVYEHLEEEVQTTGRSSPLIQMLGL